METRNAVPGFHHAATDTPRGRASWNVRDGVKEATDLVLNVDAAADRTMQVPMLHRRSCASMTRKDTDSSRLPSVPRGLFQALWRSEQAAYLTGADRYVEFCLRCICEVK